MASHPAPPYFLWCKRSESPSNSASGLATPSGLLNLSVSSSISSDQLAMPPSLASMRPLPSLISAIFRPVKSQPSTRCVCPVLFCLSARLPRSTGLSFSSVLLVAAPLPLMSPSSIPIKLPSLVGHLPVNLWSLSRLVFL